LLARALRLEGLTVGWNAVEGLVAVTAAGASGSSALLAFGLDSFIEGAAGVILTWRLRAEQRVPSATAIEVLDRRARRLVGVTFFALVAYVAFDSIRALATRERPAVSPVGIALTLVSIALMLWLAAAKGRVAAALGSRALAADAAQTTACWQLSVITLAGLGLNAGLGWWWADPIAALALCVPLTREGIEGWRGDPC
jgi:divalent metal cation (Fe/Co/Zn/Cd) transporter